MEQVQSNRSLVGASKETVQSWVADYIRQSRLPVTAEQLIKLALTVEGTHEGVTKTKVRRARTLLLSRRAA